MPPDAADFHTCFDQIIRKYIPSNTNLSSDELSASMDLCHLGFWLRIGGYFRLNDHRLELILKSVLESQMLDGGWNCRIRTKPNTVHSSFHTTFNVLEGLRQAADFGLLPLRIFEAAEARAIEFMLQHGMYKSDKTGDLDNPRFLECTYPSYWHYNILRGLGYIGTTQFISDPRLSDSLDILDSKRLSNEFWKLEKRIPGNVHFDIECPGFDSKIITLIVMRVLKAAKRI